MRWIDRFASTFLLSSLLIVAGCQEAPENPIALEQVADEPESMAAEAISVEGRVRSVFGDCAFELEDSELLFPDRVLTLCDPGGGAGYSAPANVAEGDWLRVTGVAGEMTRAAYEYKTALTLPDEVFGKRETRAVIFVRRVEMVEEPDEPEG